MSKRIAGIAGLLTLLVAGIVATQVQAGPRQAALKQADPRAAKLCTHEVKGEKSDCELVVAWYDAFFNRHEIDSLKGVVGPTYIQHNASLPNGVKPLVEYFKPYFKKFPESKSEIVRVATSGNLVWLQVHEYNRRSERQRGTAVLDIFRVKKGHIVEHWDILQPVPSKSANNNTMF